MKKLFLFFCVVLIFTDSFSQLIFTDNFSTFNLAKMDGQNGWSTSTPSLGNGTGACFSVGCQVLIVAKSMIYSGFGTCTQALNPIDGTLATQDGPGKSLSGAINSGNIYVALLVNFNTPLANPTAAKQVIRFMDNSVTTATRIYIKQITGGGAFQVGVDKNSSAAIYSSASYGYGQDHLIILKYQFNTFTSSDDVASIFIDPDLTQPEPTASASASGTTDATSITRIAFPWNANFLPNGYIGTVTTAKDWASIAQKSTTFYKVDGKIISALQKPIQNSNVKAISTTTNDSVLSATTGMYSLSNLSTNNYTIKPSKNNDVAKANGINSADVLFVQRHILNTNKITNAYKLIAADVNGDKVINATDVLRIKRLILGTDTTFTKGAGTTKKDRLWEFVDSAYIFPDTTNPFPFKDSISLTNLTSNKTNQTFIGVKLGDVNDSWNATQAKGILMDNVQLIMDIETIKMDKQLSTTHYQLPIKVKNFKNLVAMQYTLHFDNTKYDFVEIKNNKLDIEFNEKQATRNGNISVLWTDKNAQEKTLEDGTELFTLVLRQRLATKSQSLTDLTINNSITEVAAWDNHFGKHQVVLIKQAITINKL